MAGVSVNSTPAGGGVQERPVTGPQPHRQAAEPLSYAGPGAGTAGTEQVGHLSGEVLPGALTLPRPPELAFLHSSDPSLTSRWSVGTHSPELLRFLAPSHTQDNTTVDYKILCVALRKGRSVNSGDQQRATHTSRYWF